MHYYCHVYIFLYKCLYCTVNNSYLYNIFHLNTYFDPNFCLYKAKIIILSKHTHSLTHLIPQCHPTCAQVATVTRLEGKRGLSPEGLCAIEGLEDSGYLKHDRTGLWVVHPLGAVQRILQHVFKCCTHTHEKQIQHLHFIVKT